MTALTVQKVKTLLMSRVGGKMAIVGMTSASLDEPIGAALRQMGIYPEDTTTITDGDVAKVLSNYLDNLLDVAELKTLQNISGNIDLVDTTAGPIKNSYSQLAAQVETAIARLSARCSKMYGTDACTLMGGSFGMDFTETMP
jgi:hypothetical protein